MTKKKRAFSASAETTIAGVKKEMDLPRLTESVRNGMSYGAGLGAETLARAKKSSAPKSKI